MTTPHHDATATPVWTALIMAGQRPGRDALADAAGVPYKALIPIAGHSMLRHVADALLAVPQIGRVIVMAQDPGALVTDDTRTLADDPRVQWHVSGGGIAASVAQIANSDAAPWPILVTTADNPLLTRDIAERFVGRVSGSDIAVGVVDRDTVLQSYPDTRRTWLKFRGGAYSGANLFALTGQPALAALDFWAEIEQDRKKGWKIISSFGPLLLLRALTRTIRFDDALLRAGRRFSLVARPVNLKVAEAVIDVDKPDDLELVTRIMEARVRADANPR